MSTPTTARQAGAKSAAATDDLRPLSSTRSTGLRRSAALTAAALTTVAATVVPAPATHAATANRTPVENISAGAAVADLAAGGPGSAAAIPDDFAATFGYQPDIVDRLLANPMGDCSSPVTLPVEFETACKAHDLGYDLLRYAGQHGEPLGPWARQALDTTLGQHMHESCVAREDTLSRARCNTMATIAATFVDINSRRQDYGVPVTESLLGAADSDAERGFSGWLSLIVGGGILGLAAGFAAFAGAFPTLGRSDARTAGGAHRTFGDGAPATTTRRISLKQTDALGVQR
jgi:hypothetical protein